MTEQPPEKDQDPWPAECIDLAETRPYEDGIIQAFKGYHQLPFDINCCICRILHVHHKIHQHPGQRWPNTENNKLFTHPHISLTARLTNLTAINSGETGTKVKSQFEENSNTKRTKWAWESISDIWLRLWLRMGQSVMGCDTGYCLCDKSINWQRFI